MKTRVMKENTVWDKAPVWGCVTLERCRGELSYGEGASQVKKTKTKTKTDVTTPKQEYHARRVRNTKDTEPGVEWTW